MNKMVLKLHKSNRRS